MQVGRLLRYAMRKQGVSVRQLAFAIDKSEYRVLSWLRGYGAPNTVDICRKLCQTLKIRPDVLYEAIRADNVARWERTYGGRGK